MKIYHYLIVGSGLFAATFAYLANKTYRKCLVIDKRTSLDGNVYSEYNESINENTCGAQIFHTNNKELWDFVNNIVEFNINGHVAENVVEAKYQGVPVGGYNKLIDRLLEGVDTMFGMDFFKDRAKWETIADEIVFTGRLDEYFNYACGKLEYSTGSHEDIDISYSVNDERNTSLYEHYKTLANAIDNVHFGGPLAEYKYYDPASTMEAAVRLWERVR